VKETDFFTDGTNMLLLVKIVVIVCLRKDLWFLAGSCLGVECAVPASCLVIDEMRRYIERLSLQYISAAEYRDG
jgi:hypothetical protein